MVGRRRVARFDVAEAPVTRTEKLASAALCLACVILIARILWAGWHK